MRPALRVPGVQVMAVDQLHTGSVGLVPLPTRCRERPVALEALSVRLMLMGDRPAAGPSTAPTGKLPVLRPMLMKSDTPRPPPWHLGSTASPNMLAVL